MTEHLFNEFDPVSSKEWKQQIQFELKGADYNDTLVWESLEGIKIKPFYHLDEFEKKAQIPVRKRAFSILQPIFVHDITKSNQRALESLQRGAESIYFTLESENILPQDLMNGLPKEDVVYYFKTPFLSENYIKELDDWAHTNQYTIVTLNDPVGKLAGEGNWFKNKASDFATLETIEKRSRFSFLSIQAGLYQNAGANMVQQLAYTLAHLNEYLNLLPEIKHPITIEIATGSHYFFEIAKLRALRFLFKALASEYNHTQNVHIIAVPSKRNKTLYDYNVNMLRTTTECMSAILGGADAVANMPYDALYHKDNEFGDRIARNQLLILKNESYLDNVINPADGSYYIENITEQLAEKALGLFKDIEKNGGFITQLIQNTIQRKISETAQKEQELFNSGKEILLGTNKYPNPDDRMKNELELYPFVKTNSRKTLIVPIIERRISEKMEQERLNKE